MTIIKNFEIEEPKNNFKSKKFLILTFLFFGVLILVEIWINNISITYGEKFENISKLQQALQLENKILENEIAKYSSLSEISSKSINLGMTKPKNVQYLH